MKKKLFIFSNESIYSEEDKFFCDNLDLKSTPEGLNKKFEINLLGRKSFKKRTHEIKLKKIKIFSNIFSYLYEVIESKKNSDSKYLIYSITPYTFLACIFLRIFGITRIVYFRSDGDGEYNAILGKFVSCRKYILKGKSGIVIHPSQLDSVWFRKPKSLEVKNFKLLYVGRIRVEKGIYSLVNLIKNKRNISLTIVGAEKNTSYKIKQSNAKIQLTQNNKLRLIKYYDDHNIFVLPSFTEGHPMVLLEALARRRPVIIFEDISHVIGDKKGIFVAKRNFLNLIEVLNHIKKNYKKIQKDMMKNKLPTNKEFIEEFVKAIDEYK